ncbi:MAG: TonB-dependent receptor [Xanthobacteraceae bacterium]
MQSPVWASFALLATAWPNAAGAEPAQLTLPEINVIGTTPISRPRQPPKTAAGTASPSPSRRTAAPVAPAPPPIAAVTDPGPGVLERSKVPANTQTLTSADFEHDKASSVPDALLRQIPSVFINESSGNPFQPDVQYRGFLASPVLGVPQGVAVYQNGVRVNEAFGDTVNWDFIPEYAVRRLDVFPNNPVFGLNALGGAISIEMKNGFTYDGREAELRGGSFWRRAAMAQVGMRQDNVSFYVAADALNDNGWRDRSPSELRRIYADVGLLGERSELHLNFAAASNFFGATAATPIELLNRSWSAVYTTPQTYRNELALLNATGSYQPTDTLTIQGNAYFRGFWQRHVDGNSSDIQPCNPATLPNLLCIGNDATVLFSTAGPVLDFLNGATPGSIDRTSTAANSYGGTLQAASKAQLLGHGNQVVVGASLDQGQVGYKASSELGLIGPDLFVTGTGVIISQPDGTVAPVNLKTNNSYLGLYLTDTFDITSRLSATVGGRFNLAQIELADQIGTALSGSHRFSRFNPVVGATYKVTPEINAYAGYSEANRAPTPAELACADPARPCLLDNFLIADPPLKQVVAHTYEAGLRGSRELGGAHSRVTWNVGLFRTDSTDDIIHVASDITGRGFFQNAGTTRRQGIEAAATYRSDRWNVFATYSYVDATFLDTLTLSSPNNPLAVNGVITVTPGNVIPLIPLHRVKAGVEYLAAERWKLGGDLIAVGGQYLRGDESNINAKLPAYWLVNLHASYELSTYTQVFALVQNLFNRRYYTFGTFFDTTQVPFLHLTDPRTLGPGAPLAFYAGLRSRF